MGRLRRPEATEDNLDRTSLPGLLHALSMETYIEALALLFLGNAQADDHIDDLEDDEASDAAHDQRRHDGAELDQQVGIGPTDFLDIEHAGEHGTDDAAD